MLWIPLLPEGQAGSRLQTYPHQEGTDPHMLPLCLHPLEQTTFMLE